MTNTNEMSDEALVDALVRAACDGCDWGTGGGGWYEQTPEERSARTALLTRLSTLRGEVRDLREDIRIERVNGGAMDECWREMLAMVGLSEMSGEAWRDRLPELARTEAIGVALAEAVWRWWNRDGSLADVWSALAIWHARKGAPK